MLIPMKNTRIIRDALLLEHTYMFSSSWLFLNMKKINIHVSPQKNVYIHYIKDNMGSINRFLITCRIIKKKEPVKILSNSE